MTKDDRAHPDVDRFLAQAFPDDLPAEVEAKMAGRLDLFQQRWIEAEMDSAPSPIRPRRWSAVLAGTSLAAISALFVILGLQLRSSNPQAELGSALAAFQRAAFYSGRVADFQSMECTVRLNRSEKPAQQFFIQWISPEETRIRVIAAGEESICTVRPPKPERPILELIAKPDPVETAAPSRLEAELRPVEGLLSSAQFRKLLDGRWQLVGTERRGDCDWESFTVSSAFDTSPSRITIDTCTFLPMRLEKEVGSGERIEALFRWVPQTGPRGLLFRRHASRRATETTPS